MFSVWLHTPERVDVISAENAAIFNVIAMETLQYLLLFLDIKSKCRFARTCKHLYACGMHKVFPESIWKRGALFCRYCLLSHSCSILWNAETPHRL